MPPFAASSRRSCSRATRDRDLAARPATPPAVVLVVGVNGTGKTTTIAKLATARAPRAGG